MSFKNRVLVVANRTADSRELREALNARCGKGPVAFTLVVPTSGRDRMRADSSIAASLQWLREAGIEIEGGPGDPDPLIAVCDVWDPGRFDEVIVSTLPTNASRWLQIDLPHRVARITGVPVTHVVAAAGDPLQPGQALLRQPAA